MRRSFMLNQDEMMRDGNHLREIRPCVDGLDAHVDAARKLEDVEAQTS